ncbi:MAG: TrkH family potassium uptake protein [Ruminococcaceae bacterium]|nr:TrkH family potassium uptake protein [Oscillospiraceae bacterium]
MNFQVIRRMMGWILLFEALFFLLPTITAIVYREREVFSFLICIAICLILSGLCLIKKPSNQSFFAREGFVTTALSWIVLSIFGALPFVISGATDSFTDALFESVSGFTTTGATIFKGTEVDELPRCILMWRSFTHWIGGMGVLVFIMSLLPLSGAKNMFIMKAESPGPAVGKLVPKVRETASILYKIYGILTFILFLLLLLGDMSPFDALTTAFSTAGTGGFSNTSNGFSGFSNYSHIVVIIFMILFSINFTSFYFVLCGKLKDAITTEVRAFLGIIFVATLFITLNLRLSDFAAEYSFGETLRNAAFSVSSIISTTGFVTVDFNLWPSFSKTILVILMFIGACAGSTGGGMKVSRFVVLIKGIKHEMSRMLHPNQIKKISIDGHLVEHEVVRGINTYLAAYIFVFVFSLLAVSFDKFDLITNFTAVVTTMNNVGPGLEAVGPVGTFADFSVLSKLVFIFNMLVGRLEVFPMLMLFSYKTWKK